MNARTYSCADVAAVYLPEEWTDGARWLARRISSGEIPGYRVGRRFRMTDADVDAWLEAQRNPTPTPGGVAVPTPAAPPVSILDGLSSRSRRSLVRSL